MAGSPPRFDLALFLRLNEEYESKPVIAAPGGLDDASRMARAEGRASQREERVGLRGTRPYGPARPNAPGELSLRR